jgi:hypothetical protein
MNKKIAIIQTSPQRSASTLLMNAILGFILPNQFAYYVDAPGKKTQLSRAKSAMENPFIIKSHAWSVQNKWQRYLKDYECYFIASERRELGLNVDITNDRTLVIPFEMLLETPSYSLDDIVDRLYKKFLNFLPKQLTLDKKDCVKRLRGMNDMTRKMSNKSFLDYDLFYGIHGGHRNRGGKNF